MTVLERINAYCAEVLQDDKYLDHCKALYQAITRFKNDLLKQDFEFEFIEKEAHRAIAFCEKQIITSGVNAGSRLTLDPWQVFLVANIFGWRFKADQTRFRFKKIFCFIGKGAGKSPLAAAIGLYAQTFEMAGEVYSLAVSREQAEISFSHAKNFIELNPAMQEMFEVYAKAILYTPKKSVFKTLSSAWKASDGKNPICIIADEVAAMSTSRIIDPIESALFKRQNSIEIMITTANYISTTSPGYLEYKYSKQILAKPELDDRYFALLYEIDEGDNWQTVSLKKANPSSFFNYGDLEAKRKEAMNRAGTYADEFRTKSLNQWLIGSSNQYVPIEKWETSIDNAKKYAAYITTEKLKNYPCTIGADFSNRRDLSVYTIAYYIQEIDKVYLQHYPYIPQYELQKKALNENRLFNQWVEQKLVRLCPDEYISKTQIAHDINESIIETGAKSFGYDPNFSAEVIENIQIPIVPYNQKGGMSIPAIDFREMIINGKIIDASPIMYWCISNACIYEASDGYTHVFKENKDSPKKIDLVISSIMACHRLQEVARVSAKPKVEIDYDALSKLIYGN